ncbi:hypothetical protein RSOLAG1IB_11932 [Rhizoctonia solani AG-1 IB]|uniref:Uncharacterized protein n=1 Tax=Thanatephorus cucumeris (strain AG1-IB / isolate 7/3/14) TaxID=1108050 RepID=A0A0B7FFR0_THACB|nr:hypothetical protein RSOLAG1IB_11932 [Rhizoctonia solani AG-1 IB]
MSGALCTSSIITPRLVCGFNLLPLLLFLAVLLPFPTSSISLSWSLSKDTTLQKLRRCLSGVVSASAAHNARHRAVNNNVNE